MGLAVRPTIKSEQAKAGRRFEKAEGLADISAKTMLKEKRNPRALVAVVKVQSIMREARLQGGTECNLVISDFKFHLARDAHGVTD